MEGWPPYWAGLPPMHYASHAIAPIFALAGTRARSVHCFGSGVMRAELHAQYGNPFPVETAIYEMDNDTPLAAEVTRSLFHTARDYTESFNIYGEKATFEWEQLEGEDPILFRMSANESARRGNKISVERIGAPDRQDLLPAEIARFTQRGVYDETKPHLSFMQGGGHGGSHPHMVHEFVSSIVEGRQPLYDVVTSANWTAAGLCAHESAMQHGARVEVPGFTL
jgi:predicted dehydrogenase